MVETLWAAYVRRLLEDSGEIEAEFLREKSVQQGTFNRWKRGEVTPDKAAPVALFARECGRNVLEAFVAAGMLSLEDALGTLDDASLTLLAELEGEARFPGIGKRATSARRRRSPGRTR